MRIELRGQIKIHWALWLAPALLLLAPLEWPYGYYTFLRLCVCICAGFIAFATWERGALWALALGGLALLFNPLIPVHLDRETWVPINLVGAGLLGAIGGW